MHTVQWLTNLVEHHQLLAYVIIYLGLVFEGEFIVISVGILAHLGALNLFGALIFILLGGFSKTVLGYAVGQFFQRHFNRNGFLKYMNKKVKSFLPRFRSRPFWSIFASKFILGANHIVILFCGYENISYRKFLKAEILSTLIWAPTFLLLGYFFSYTALHVSHEIWRFSMIVLVLFLMFIIFDKMVGWLYELFEEFQDENS
jgi:membrane protein DedA with SNARE-associated domain